MSSCGNETLRHMHNAAHGIPGTHMSGSERFECECGFYVGNWEDAEKLGLNFVLDTKEKE